MKLLCFVLCCGPVIGQQLSVGIKGGTPLTSTSDSVREVGRYGGETSFQLKRYTAGPYVEIGLPYRFRLEAGALYKYARQDRFSGPAPTGNLVQQGIRMNIWEFPLLLKYGWSTHGLQAFVVGGCTVRRVEDLDIDHISIPTFPGFPGTRQQYTISSGEPLRYGVTLGAGVSRRLRFISFEPELRYTHWTAKRWMATTEQIELLLGLRFALRAED
jgi:hypothetical protein